jgi:hypothetical protein
MTKETTHMATKKAPAKTSKTARSSMPQSAKKGGLDISTDITRLIPLGTDTPYAYVLTADGKTVHCAVGSGKFYELVATLVDTNVARLTAARADELEARKPGVGWAKAAQMLRGELVDTAGEDAAAEIAAS